MGFKFWWVFMVSSLHVWIPAANPESKEPEVIIWQKLRMWPLRWVFSFLWQQRLSSSSQSSGQKTLDNFLEKKNISLSCVCTNFCVPSLDAKSIDSYSWPKRCTDRCDKSNVHKIATQGYILFLNLKFLHYFQEKIYF